MQVAIFLSIHAPSADVGLDRHAEQIIAGLGEPPVEHGFQIGVEIRASFDALCGVGGAQTGADPVDELAPVIERQVDDLEENDHRQLLREVADEFASAVGLEALDELDR
jgi:hypothetical protein